MDSRHYDPDKLKELRERFGLTQEQVAEKLNIHKQSVYRAEAGRVASYELLCALSALYKTEVIGLLRRRPLAEKVA
jgi:transcriptional regulator with XRE-family HTH domain